MPILLLTALQVKRSNLQIKAVIASEAWQFFPSLRESQESGSLEFVKKNIVSSLPLVETTL
jgi:hypothetical protein